jgi:uncharacterized protein YhfF
LFSFDVVCGGDKRKGWERIAREEWEGDKSVEGVKKMTKGAWEGHNKETRFSEWPFPIVNLQHRVT